MEQSEHTLPDGHADARAKPRLRPAPSRSAHHALLFGITKNKRALIAAAAGVVLMVGIVAILLLYTDLDWARLFDTIDHLNPVAVLPLMALLPIVGFPIAIVYLVAGARFGPIGGGVVVAVVTAIHLLGTHAIARSFLREPLRRFIGRKHLHLPEVPEDEQAMVCVIAALVPGLPYVVRNYLLSLAGVRLKILLAICVPIYVARSYVTILLGDMGNDPSRNRLIVLVLIDALKVAICALVIWRLRVHHRKFHGEEHHDQDVAAPPNAAAP